MNKKYSLIELIKKEPKDRPKVVRREWRFWPTEASCIGKKGQTVGKCLRNSYYQWGGYDITNPVNDFVKQCGDMGNFLELKTINEFKSKNIFPYDKNKKDIRKQQVPILDGTAELSGEVDIFISGGTQSAGVEVKSYVCGTAKQQAEPKEAHLLQTFLYLCLFTPVQPYFILYYRPSPLSKWATEEIVYRIDKVTIEGKTYPVINSKINRDITLEGILERYALLKKCVETKTMPNKEFTKSNKACLYCPYKEKCWS